MKAESVAMACAVGALLTVGVVMIDSATVTQWEAARWRAHLLWLGCGLAAGVGATLIPYRWLKDPRVHRLLLGAAVLLLVAVLIPGVGEKVNGERRWFRFGGQPSELAKLILPLWVAAYAAARAGCLRSFRAGFLKPMAVIGLVAGLVFVEQDWGTALLLAGTGTVMLLVAGTRLVFVLPLVPLGAAVLALLVKLDPGRKLRLLCFWDLEKYADGPGWQQWHSLLSLGVGGLWGSRVGGGSHKFGFVPEQQTDFVFSLIGEELGFVGTSFVLAMYATIFACGMRMVWRVADPFARLLVGGLTTLITLQALVNIGVATASLPNKGIPLPFVSYGGSDMVCLLAAVGMVLGVARQAPRVPEAERVVEAPDPVAQAHRARLALVAETRRWRPSWRRWLGCRRVSPAHAAPAPLRPYQRAPRRGGGVAIRCGESG
ncbi:MAG TPA: FtsW/RodA/SpoVE family cell cycle protein [Verrucomicrobiota bacterium]|nr:FtsW/RodA/SpoVE family cell cycle protein [Verrucomicrobiota bacterium]HNU51746.1 FtsW/RodA/SpoVE family cell cycle protein [Verrucomicrobiota bacterium]